MATKTWMHHVYNYRFIYIFITILTLIVITRSVTTNYTFQFLTTSHAPPLILTCLYDTSQSSIEQLSTFLTSTQQHVHGMDIHVIVPDGMIGKEQRKIHDMGATVIVKSYPQDRSPALGRFTLFEQHLDTLPSPPRYILLIDISVNVLLQADIASQIDDVIHARSLSPIDIPLIITREHHRMSIKKCDYTSYYIEAAYDTKTLQTINRHPLLCHIVVMGSTSNVRAYVTQMRMESDGRSEAVKKIPHADQGIHNYVVYTHFRDAKQLHLSSSPFYSLRYVPNIEKRMDRNALILNSRHQAPAIIAEYAFDKTAATLLHQSHPTIPNVAVALPWHVRRKGESKPVLHHQHEHEHEHEHDMDKHKTIQEENDVDDDDGIIDMPDEKFVHHHHDDNPITEPFIAEDGYYAYAPPLPDHAFKPKDPASGT